MKKFFASVNFHNPKSECALCTYVLYQWVIESDSYDKALEGLKAWIEQKQTSMQGNWTCLLSELDQVQQLKVSQ